MKRTWTCSRRAFTLIELLVVIVVIMVLVGILMPTIYGTKKQAKIRQARAEMKALEAAIVNYKFQNREWPSDTHTDDTSYTDDNHIVIDKLLAQTPPLVDTSDFWMGADYNEKYKIKQYDDQTVLDPWNAPYGIELDSNYDGYWGSVQFLAGVTVWSAGPDGKRGTGDDP